MALTSRTRKILLALAGRKGHIPMEDLARELDVSQRTMYRELSAATSALKEFGIELESAGKMGIRMVATSDQLRDLRDFLGEADEVLLVDPSERIDYMLLYLIRQDDYVKMRTIASDTQSVFSTVRGDLERAKGLLGGYELELVQRKGAGVLLRGPRMEKDRLASDILLRRIDEANFFAWLNQRKYSSGPFLGWVEQQGPGIWMLRMHEPLNSTFGQAGTLLESVRAKDYLELLLMLSLMMSCHGTRDRYDRHMDSNLDDETIQHNFRMVLALLETFADPELDECERSFVGWAVQVSIGKRITVAAQSQTLDKSILSFIDYVEDRTGIKLSHDKELFEGLYVHMDRALVRIRSNMQIENPILADIKKEHAELFQVVRDGVRSCFPKDRFPDDELGYLVIYFATAFDKLTKRIFRVIVVCSGGMGSSKMLASTLEREIPEITVEKTLSVVALGNERLEDYDLVLSTIPLYIDDDAYLRVSPMLSKGELDLVKEKVRRHKHGQLRRIDEGRRYRTAYKNDDSVSVLERAQSASAAGLELLWRFGYHTAGAGSVSDAIRQVLGQNGPVWGAVEPHEVQTVSEFLLPLTSTIFYEGICPSIDGVAIFALRGSWDDADSAIAFVYSEALEKPKKRLLRFLIEHIIEGADFNECLRSDLARDGSDNVRGWLGFRIREYLEQIVSE